MGLFSSRKTKEKPDADVGAGRGSDEDAHVAGADHNEDASAGADGGEELDPQETKDFADLQHLAAKRDIRCTIRKGTQAGVAAGLSVTAGTIAAGPPGAVVGGVVGTALAAKIARGVVPLRDVLERSPPAQRREVLRLFHASFKEEFEASIRDNPELKLLMARGSIFGVVRYMVDRDLIESKRLEKLDNILSKVPDEVLKKVKSKVKVPK